MRAGVVTKSHILPKFMLAVFTAIFVAAPAVAYNVQASIAEPEFEISAQSSEMWIAPSDDISGAVESDLWLLVYFPNLSDVDIFGASDQFIDLNGEACDPGSGWWCREGTE